MINGQGFKDDKTTGGSRLEMEQETWELPHLLLLTIYNPVNTVSAPFIQSVFGVLVVIKHYS
jgi:hypothetical protein